MIRKCTLKYFANITKMSEFTTKVYMARFNFKKVTINRKAFYICTDEKIREFRDFAKLMKEKRGNAPQRRIGKKNKRS